MNKQGQRDHSPPPCGEGLGEGVRRRPSPLPLPPPARGGGKRSRGFTLVSAIFLMVVLVILGASLVTLGSVQHITTAQQLQSVRAYYAAKAGAEWAAKRAGSAGDCTAAPTFVLDNFSLAVSCTSANHDLNGALTPYYVVSVTATSGSYGGTDYVSRRVQAKILGNGP